MNKEQIFIQKLENISASYPKFIDLSLKRVLCLLDKLGNPHLNIPPVIHVAGTNGKGSTISTLLVFLKKIIIKFMFIPHLI